MPRQRWMVASVVLVLIGGLIVLGYRDPETRVLDAAARSGATGSFVALEDGVTHYEVAGSADGDRVMLVHGFSVPGYIWDSTVVALTAAGFRVARYDTFGRGFSDRPDSRYDADLYDRQLRGLLDSLGWVAPVHLVGLSFGGPVSAGFASRHPGRVRTLTLVDPAAGAIGGVPWFLRLPVLGQMLWQAVVVPGLAEGQASDFVEPDKWPDWADRYRVQMQFRGFGRALLRTRLEASTMSLDSVYRAAGATKVPTLLIWGTKDQTVPIMFADSIRRSIPHLQYHPVEGAGHLPHMERSGEVHATLIDFIRAATPVDSAAAVGRDKPDAP